MTFFEVRTVGSASMSRQLIVPKRRISRKVFVLRVTIVLLLSLITAEVALRLGFAVFRPGVNVRTLTDEQYDLSRHVLVGRRNTQPDVLHPYVGFVLDPTRNQDVNSFGFWQIDGPLLKRTPNSLIVGITGGSVARELCSNSAETIRRELSRIFPEKKVQIVCLAQDGFREPQLAMTVSYFQMLGAEFDAVVSVSGFNEAVLHPAESPADDLWIGYPRAWNVRLTDTEDPEVNRLIWEGQTVQVQRTDWAVQAYKLRHIPLLTIHGLWSAVDSHYKNRLVGAAANLMNSRIRIMNRYANVGPSTQYSSRVARTTAQCNMWLAGSRQIQRLCKSMGARFLLCLQPNLHDSKGKVMTEDEKIIAMRGSIYQEWVLKNYEHFANAGTGLKSEGIAFSDLRTLYDDVSSTVYRDECCHFNQNGNDLLATRIATLIAAELNQQERLP